MTLDAMHWVWNHSQSKGNTRLALLCAADRVRTSACEVRLSYADFMAALNAGRPAIRDALRAAEKLGEIEIVEPGKGTRAALYRLPKAVDYVRPASSSGSKIKPLEDNEDRSSGLNTEPLDPQQTPASGSKSEPQDGASGLNFDASGSKFDPHYQYASTNQQAGAKANYASDAEHGIPEWARPLVDGLTNAGVVVRWPFKGTQWFPVHSLIKKSGTPAMVKHAVKVASRTNVESAKYFMQGWSELSPLPQERPASRDSSSQPPVPDWCGKCDRPDYRWLENGTGYVRCRNCNPDAIGATP